MRAFSGWSWKNTFTPRTLIHSRNQIVKIEKIHCINPGIDFNALRRHPVVFITGDGKTSKKWEFRDMKARIHEPLSPSLEELVPAIHPHFRESVVLDFVFYFYRFVELWHLIFLR